MDSTCDLIIDSLKDEPIGETNHFTWFVTDIGIAALFKRSVSLFSDPSEGRDKAQTEHNAMKAKDLRCFSKHGI